MTSTTTIEKAFKIYRTALSEGGLNLCKWDSNSAELLCRVQVAESVLGDRTIHAEDNAATVMEEEEQ